MLSADPNGFRYFVELAFNGTAFHGWQLQPGAETVQGIMNHALATLIRQPVNLVGCGRTDSGVHASHFVAHFDAGTPILDCDQLVQRLNRFINQHIRVDRILPVPAGFHARFQATSRTYHYLISTGKSPFMQEFSWEYPKPVNVDAMNRACSALKGTHDFTSFSKLHTDVKTNVCEVTEAFWTIKPGFLIFEIRSDRFLRNMVRAIIGTLLEVGRRKLQPEDVEKILIAKDRSRAGMSVPAKGLFLTRVEYAPEVFRIEPKYPFTDWF